ncbi:MAG: hypothetical protein JXJ04_07235 [Spirochaetales bacterium]|nr:hypothetical protein [Spirochaetales bacterium]
MKDIDPLDIAVIGMSCYFPEADNIEQFWNNLKNGICSVKFYSQQELLERGVNKNFLNHPDYVKASPYFSRARLFDAGFFKINPGEANILDPQRRLFFENCYHALEDGGYVPEKYSGKIGVFGSTGINFYGLDLIANKELLNTVSPLQIITSNEKDGLPTQASYLLDLTGPSVNVNCTCSSTLVAIHLARQSLLLGDSDMVLAGGSTVILPENEGYFYERDGILSKDGYCRAFDDDSSGTLWGSGTGVVLLKRLSDAVQDGDNIRAIIKGSAINNDGSKKVGYTAPSLEGQSEVIVQAYASSGISPETVSYIEAHGTGTKIGDPIEVKALTKAFREYTDAKNFCGLGSVKTNFGHLGASAGIASFIKAVLALDNKQIPPSLHFKTPNKSIDFENSPFYVNTELKDMKNQKSPLRFGVSSLGVGGTNAHIILEEVAKEFKESITKESKDSVIILSARNEKQLNASKMNLVHFLENNKDISLRNLSFTLQNGRRNFKNKMAVTAATVEEAIKKLKSDNSAGIITESDYPEKISAADNEIKNKLVKWFKDEDVDWYTLYKDEKPRRISLPAYPFEESTYWIESNRTDSIATEEDDTLAHRTDNMADWLYYQSWKQTSLPPAFSGNTGDKKNYIVFVDTDKLGSDVGQKLESMGDKVIYVYPGKKYGKKENHSYEINPEDPESFQSLIKDLIGNNLVPDSILHFYGLNGGSKNNVLSQVKSVFSFQKYGLVFLTNLVKTIVSNKIVKKIDLISVVNNVYNIQGNEDIFAEKSTIPSALKVIQQEYPNFTSRVIEINSHFLKNPNRTTLMVNELLSKNTDIICSYRGNMRWVLGYNKIVIEAENEKKSVFKKNGVYFIFGGTTGGIPFIYEYINKTYDAKLILLDDFYLPPEKEWDKWLEENGANEYNSLRIKTVKKLKSFGVEFIDGVDILSVAGKVKAEKKIKEFEKKYGKINGIIHAAGGYAAGRIAPLSESYDILNNQLGMYNLASIGASLIIINDIFKNRDLDFRYLWASLSTVLAGPAFLTYAASDSVAITAALRANSYLKQPWGVICWDSLESEWFEDLVEERMKIAYDVTHDRIADGLITTDEANKCLEILSGVNAQFNPIITSCSDLYKRYNIWIKRDYALRTKKGTHNAVSKSRPNLTIPYEPPQTELEKSIIDIMEQLLNIKGIGRNDNFFELGGNSLIGIQYASKIREISKVDLGMDKIYEYQSAANIAEFIEKGSNE